MSQEGAYYPDYGLQVEDAASAGDKLGAANLVRYWWAWTFLELSRRSATGPMRVVDVGCGCGYGTRILSENMSGTVCGIDWDHSLVKHARKSYATPENFYRRINLKIPWATQFADTDIAVCFSVLDEVAEWEFLVREMAASLSRDGALLLSQPDSLGDRLHSELSNLFTSVVTDSEGEQQGTPEHKLFKYV